MLCEHHHKLYQVKKKKKEEKLMENKEVGVSVFFLHFVQLGGGGSSVEGTSQCPKTPKEKAAEGLFPSLHGKSTGLKIWKYIARYYFFFRLLLSNTKITTTGKTSRSSKGGKSSERKKIIFIIMETPRTLNRVCGTVLVNFVSKTTFFYKNLRRSFCYPFFFSFTNPDERRCGAINCYYSLKTSR